MARKIIVVVIFLIIAITSLPVDAETTVSFQTITVNGVEIDCLFFVSETEYDWSLQPPDIPKEIPETGLQIEEKNYLVTIKCYKKEDLTDVVRILRIMAGIRE